MSDISSYFGGKSATDDTDDIFSQIAKTSSEIEVDTSTNQSIPNFAPTLAADRIWFASPDTVQIIEKVQNSPQSRDEPEISASRTVPVVFAEKQVLIFIYFFNQSLNNVAYVLFHQTDPLKDSLLQRNRSEALATRNFPTALTVSKDIAGLRQLVVCN